MGQPGLALGVVAPPKGDKEFVEYGTAALFLSVAHAGESSELDRHIGFYVLLPRHTIGNVLVCLMCRVRVVITALSAVEEHDVAIGLVGLINPGRNDAHLLYIVLILLVENDWTEPVHWHQPTHIPPLHVLGVYRERSSPVLHTFHHFENEVSIYVLHMVQAPLAARILSVVAPTAASVADGILR